MNSAVLTHAAFQRPPVKSKRRRGRLPPNVVSIRSVPRLRVGAIAEIVVSGFAQNVGIRVRIVGHNAADRWCWQVESLGRDIECLDGALDRKAWIQPGQLRRCWTGGVS